MVVRLATAADLARIAEIELSAATRFIGTHVEFLIGEESFDEAELAAARAAGNLFVAADDGGAAIGFAFTSELDGYLYIHELDVRRERQGQGHGRALLDAVAAEARRRGLAGVSLTTDRTVPWNHPFYTRYGFAELAADAVPPGLQAHLDAEIAKGLDPARRCAMVLRVR
jgi:GNAT superfamily N-acetyltransferase